MKKIFTIIFILSLFGCSSESTDIPSSSNYSSKISMEYIPSGDYKLQSIRYNDGYGNDNYYSHNSDNLSPNYSTGLYGSYVYSFNYDGYMYSLDVTGQILLYDQNSSASQMVLDCPNGLNASLQMNSDGQVYYSNVNDGNCQGIPLYTDGSSWENYLTEATAISDTYSSDENGNMNRDINITTNDATITISMNFQLTQ